MKWLKSYFDHPAQSFIAAACFLIIASRVFAGVTDRQEQIGIGVIVGLQGVIAVLDGVKKLLRRKLERLQKENADRRAMLDKIRQP